jgi:hypothetical protein
MNMTRKQDLMRAAANSNLVFLRQLLSDPEFQNSNEEENGIRVEALRCAVQSHHAGIVIELWNKVTITDAVLEGLRQLNIYRDNGSSGSKEIFNILNPEIAAASNAHIMNIDTQIAAYNASHVFNVDQDLLKNLGDFYLQYEGNYEQEYQTQKDASFGLTRDNVKQYMINAIQHMNIYLLQAQKLDDDAKFSPEHKALRMLYAISACAFYLKRDSSTHIVASQEDIPWTGLAVFVREQQYNPNFLTKIATYAYKQKLMVAALYRIQASGELENLRLYLAADDRTELLDKFPKINALIGFLADEYNAQYVEDSIKNSRLYADHATETGRERILMSFIKLGEALENASSRLQGLFDGNALLDVMVIRNVLCHVESPYNMLQIKDFINGVSIVITTSNRNINLEELIQYWFSDQTHDLIRNFLEIYSNIRDVEPSELWDSIESVQDSYVQPHPVDPERQNEGVLIQIKQQYIKDLEKAENDKATKLDSLSQDTIAWFNQNFSKDKDIPKKVNDPQKEIIGCEKALQENKAEYDMAVTKKPDDRTKAEKKLVNDYENVVTKKSQWDGHFKKTVDIQKSYEQELQDAANIKEQQTKDLIISLVGKVIIYAEKAELVFAQLNDFKHMTSTSAGELSRGFKSHQDHPLLEFYQVMVGSLARGLLSIESFMQDTVSSQELRDMLEKEVAPSRGYLAHIGVRQLGEGFSDALDRASVFYTNSKKIIEAKELLGITLKALSQNRTFVDVESDNLFVVVEEDTPSSSASGQGSMFDVDD